MNPTGVAAVRWWTSPACARILEYLECQGAAKPQRIAAAVHCDETYCERLISLLLKPARLVHVTGWLRNHNGGPTPVYGLGPGKNQPKPRVETNAQRTRRRRAALRAQFGRAIANKVLDAKKHGYPRIIIEGRRVMPGSHGSQLAKRGQE